MIDGSLINKKFPQTRFLLRWWQCSLLIHAHLSSWHQGASSATFFYSVILQKQSLWGGGGSSKNQSSPFRNPALLLRSLHPPGQAFSSQLCCAKVRKSNMVRTMPCGLTLDYEQRYCTYISLGAVLASPSVYATQQS